MKNNNQHKTGFKHTALGWIPDGWSVIKLDKVIKLINGRPFKPEDWKEVGLPIIRIQNLNNSTAPYNYYDQPVQEKYYVETGDILFAWSGTKGVSFGARVWTNGKAILNQHIFKVIPIETFLTKNYSYLVLNKVQNAIESNAHGFKSSFVHVKKFDLDKTLLPLPPIPEQLKITNILNTWDDAIARTQELITQLKQRNKGLITLLLNGKKRLKGFKSAKAAYSSIHSFAKEVSDKNASDKELVVLSCTKYDGLVPSLEYFGRKIYSDDLTTYKIVSKNCFAYATNHIEEGSIGYQAKYEAALISPMYTVFKTNDSVDDEYLYKVLKSHHYIHEYQKRMEGSIDRRGGLRWDEFSKIKVLLPSVEEQRAIAGILNKADEEVKLQQQQLAAFQLQKKGLMQKLLTGEIRLKTDHN